MSDMPDKARVGSITLKRVPEGKAPEHYLWKRSLEKEWAGEWTLAKLTGYRYRMALDPAFVEELPEEKRGKLHWYELILCANGGIVSLYSETNRTGALWTTKQTGEKVLAEVKGAKLHLTSDERLGLVVHFPLEAIRQVCELAGARRARRVSEAQREKLRERGLKVGFGSGKKAPPTERQRQHMAANPSARGSQEFTQG